MKNANSLSGVVCGGLNLLLITAFQKVSELQVLQVEMGFCDFILQREKITIDYYYLVGTKLVMELYR